MLSKAVQRLDIDLCVLSESNATIRFLNDKWRQRHGGVVNKAGQKVGNQQVDGTRIR